tara:strand:+ start:2398 stop:2556 length:159 start_codon:yes stop_codon:yes gene_type:complete
MQEKLLAGLSCIKIAKDLKIGIITLYNQVRRETGMTPGQWRKYEKARRKAGG